MATKKRPTKKQLAARKKFVAAVRSGKWKKKPRKKVVLKKAARKTSTVKIVVRRSGTRPRRSASTIPALKSRIREKLDQDLMQQLFKRDKATTYKQHRAAQLKIDKIRRELRRLK